MDIDEIIKNIPGKVKYVIVEVEDKPAPKAPTKTYAISPVSEKIRMLRLESKLSQAEVAERIKMARPNYTRIETGRHEPSLATLRKIAEALGVSLQKLIFSE